MATRDHLPFADPSNGVTRLTVTGGSGNTGDRDSNTRGNEGQNGRDRLPFLRVSMTVHVTGRDAVDFEEMFTRATAELDVAETKLQAAQQRVEELRTIRDGMRLAMERYGPAKPSPPGQDEPEGTKGASTGTKVTAGTKRRTVRRRQTGRPAPEVSQTDLCIVTLTEFGRPTSTTEIRDRLLENGHSYNPEQIRSALAYLLRQNRVERVTNGVWALPGAVTGAPVNGSALNGSAPDDSHAIAS
jgi:hypothetical protein